MDVTKQPYKHLKLDKFVYGSKQKIIKTTTQLVDVENGELTNYPSVKKNVYYFSDIDDNLIDFHQINFDYINNKKGKISVQSYVDNYNPTFTISANIAKHQTTQQDGQRIAYFPQYIYTPIDITQFKNSCYLLLPISTNKFVNIAHPNKLINEVQKFKTSPISATISSNIAPHMKFYDRAAYTPEDNSIPVYDMNFEDLQTIKFPSTNDLYIWLLKWGLQNIIYQDQDGQYHSLINEIMFDSVNGLSFKQIVDYGSNAPEANYDSILLKPFIDYLMSKKYLYSKDTRNKMLSELFGVLASTSTERYFKLVGKINNLNRDLLSSVKSDLSGQGIYNINDLLTRKQDVTFDPVVLPQNTLLIDSIQEPIVYDQDKPQKEYLPSCYINFINLKNNRDPQYQLNCTINDIQINNDIFVNDYRFSVQNNSYYNRKKYLSTMNEQMTLDVVTTAIKNDNALITNEGYVSLFPQRMETKQQYYLSQYNDKHICNNTLYNIGMVNGIRNYLHVGTSFNKTAWLSYSYDEKPQSKFTIYNDYYCYQLNGKKYNVEYETSQIYDENVNEYIDFITSFYFIAEDKIRYNIQYSKLLSTWFPSRYDKDIEFVNIQTINNSDNISSNIAISFTSKIKQLFAYQEPLTGYYYEGLEGEKKEYKDENTILIYEGKYYLPSALYTTFNFSSPIYFREYESIGNEIPFNNKTLSSSQINSIFTKNGNNVLVTIKIYDEAIGREKEVKVKHIANSKTFKDDTYKTLKLPFYGYSLDRDSQWIKDYNGNNKTTCIMKSYNLECPWGEDERKKIIGCTLPLTGQCSGFCTFPCKGQIKSNYNDNRGLNWNLNQYYDLHKGLEDVRAKMNNGVELTNNAQWFIIPSSKYDQLIIANEDIQVNDDIEVFITSTDINSRAEFIDLVSNLTFKQELQSIFQGFWNDGDYQEFRYTDDKYEIAPHTKFNGPHIITKDTVISAYNLDYIETVYEQNLRNETIEAITKKIDYKNYIPASCYCLIRVKSWWSDTVKCEGSIKVVQKADLDEENIMQQINNYDFIETVDGFFKFKQTGLHKSNIYSINLKNTGLSRGEDKVIKYYTKKEVIKLLENKYFIKYYQDEDSFLVNSDQNAFIHAIYDSTDNTIFKRTPLFKNLEHNNLSGFVLNYVTIPFDHLVAYQGMSMELDQNYIQTYYYKQQLIDAQDYNEVRQNIRQLVQKAIRQSITRYMPADTNLWKVEFRDQ